MADETPIEETERPPRRKSVSGRVTRWALGILAVLALLVAGFLLAG